MMAALVLGSLLLILGMLPSPDVEANRIHQPLLDTADTTQPEPMDAVHAASLAPVGDTPVVPPRLPGPTDTPGTSSLPAGEARAEVIAEPTWSEVEIRPGDNLSLIFARAGLTPRDVYEVMHGDEPRRELTRLRPGQTMQLALNEDGTLNALRLQPDRLRMVTYVRDGERYARDEIVYTPERRPVYRQAVLNDSLFLSGARAGLPDAVLMEMADIFSGVIDFVLDPRRGDAFSVLYEELWLHGERIGLGNILAAEYVNEDKPFIAYRYEDENGASGYYDENGVSMQRAFLRAPLDFRRISSHFNPRRMHPVLKQVRPHRGIDYAAAVGTPVYAAGDGRVVASGYDRANGNYVFIQHGEKYQTKYLHLHKRTVRTGQKVKQKQIIGHVGATGLVTGPHLHYEFLINGVHRNPRTVVDQLPRARSIEDDERGRFIAAIAPYQQKLASYRQAWQFAQAGDTTGE